MDRWTTLSGLKSWPENKIPILHGTVGRKSASLLFINTVIICDYRNGLRCELVISYNKVTKFLTSLTIKLRNFFLGFTLKLRNYDNKVTKLL